MTLYPASIGCVIITLVAISTGYAAESDQAFLTCPTFSDDQVRLACYDSYAPREESMQPLLGNGVDGLTMHEPNKLLARLDSQDERVHYMDASLSVKYPVLNPVVDAISSVINIDRVRNTPRLYLAFTTRFSQYVATRQSSPVVARRYNPELFLRVWRDGVYDRTNPSHWDFGYGHESNGQRISDPQGYRLAADAADLRGDPEITARESISRGWDYLSIDWVKEWNTPFLVKLAGRTETQIEYRHYLDHGLFQGDPEEYNVWEGDGAESRPRANYSCLQFALAYTLPDEPFSDWVCFERVELEHTTGYARPFDNNSTSLEVTTQLAGIPLYFWARTGYNSDLVDYYKYTNSWGIGMEFLR